MAMIRSVFARHWLGPQPGPVPCSPAERAGKAYRLVDALLRPHPQLDGLYDSIDEAFRDAIAWLESSGAEAATTAIGLDVSTESGQWRTIRLPTLLLCPMPASS